MQNKFDEAFQQADAENTGQRVYYTIKDLKKDPDATRKRWVWELLQNAHDARQVEDKRRIIVEIKYKQNELVFLHNGRGFNAAEIAHLIRSGSTKDETDETTHGQYGTGLLTTHLLSSKIHISGQLDDGSSWFDFSLVRDDDSPEALLKSLDKAKKTFMESISPNKPLELGNLTTRFGLPIGEVNANTSVRTGIETLKQCAPYVLIFNEAFRSITIEDHEGIRCYEVVDSAKSELSIQQITVIEYKNGKERKREYLLAQDEKKTSVIAPLESNEDGGVCLQVEKTPRLFKGFPLVGTESFSFPAVINSFNFNVQSTRHNVPLQESQENQANRAVIKEACPLLVGLVEYAASEHWHHIYRWTQIPIIQYSTEETKAWLRKCIRENLIGKIRQTPMLLNADDHPIVPREAKLPLAKNETNVQILWSLYESLNGERKFLPRREEATGWCDTIKSWSAVYQNEMMALFSEGRDGTKLALSIEKYLEKHENGRIEHLQKIMQENVSTIDWLNQFYSFLKNNGFNDEIQNRRIVLDQSGGFHRLRDLYRDNGIDKELKDIAELPGWSIRSLLRDTQLFSLKNEIDVDNWNNKKTVRTLIEWLQIRATDNPDDNFKIASARIFAWIVGQDQTEYWKHLQDVPVFTKDSTCYRSLSSASLSDTSLLAPIRAWPKNLQQFSELFPSDRILADSFYKAISNTCLWQGLCEQNFIRRNMIRRRIDLRDLKPFSPEIYENEDDGRDHESEESFSAIRVVAWEAIIEKARNSRDNAYLFWRFLTEYLITRGNEDLEEKIAQCKSCGKNHKYYLSIWLKAVRINKWIRQGDLRFQVDAQSLANLLREKGWKLHSLENPTTVKLLNAIDVLPSDLRFELITGNPEARDALVNTMTELHQITKGDLSQVHAIVQHVQKVDGDLSQTLELIQHMQEDENFSEYLADRQEQTRRVHENQHLGTQVENLVRENLEGEGFLVNHTGIGSDFEVRLDVVRDDKNWLIEVKSTRQEGNHQSIRMTSTQAQTAVKEKDKFLLCVVPLGPEDVTSETVRENMRFIQNIGDSVVRLCENLDWLEEVRTDITADASYDVELVIEAGKASILVKKPVWENQGFPLANLIKNLK